MLRFWGLMLGSAVFGFGQMLSVDLRVSGLDCASCAESVEKKLTRVRGVVSAKFEVERAVAVVKLAPHNTVTLDALRDALKGIGYTPGDAEVAVLAKVVGNRVDLPHQVGAFVLAAVTEISGRVRIEGTVVAGANKLKARTLRPE